MLSRRVRFRKPSASQQGSHEFHEFSRNLVFGGIREIREIRGLVLEFLEIVHAWAVAADRSTLADYTPGLGRSAGRENRKVDGIARGGAAGRGPCDKSQWAGFDLSIPKNHEFSSRDWVGRHTAMC